MRCVLASKSPARKQTLLNAGIAPIIIVSDIDEEAVLNTLPGGRAFSGGDTTPADEVSTLATAKCRAVGNLLSADSTSPDMFDSSQTSALMQAQNEQLLVIGCDSMLEINGTMAGKPHTPDVAIERIRAMRGTSAILWTGHHAMLLSPADSDGTRHLLGEVTQAAQTTVHFGNISDAEIEAYVATGEPLHVAGSFTVDALGGPFITGIEGDYHSVVGISLPLMRNMATELNIFWPDLWERNHKID